MRLLEARLRSRLLRLAVATIAVGVAFGTTMLLRAWTPHAVFMLFLPAVMVSAWYGQLLAGTFATLLSVLLVGEVVLKSSLLEEIEFTIVATLVPSLPRAAFFSCAPRPALGTPAGMKVATIGYCVFVRELQRRADTAARLALLE